MARNPATTWNMLNEAFLHYQDYINRKPFSGRYKLTFLDLLYVSNFKGGNASIIEPQRTLPGKLQAYEHQLSIIYKKYHSKQLQNLTLSEVDELTSLCLQFVKLTLVQKTKIAGFGRSYASALLAAHLPETIPILDRRVLNGAKIPHQVNNSKQVINIETYYPALISKMWATLRNPPSKKLRELDKEWFLVPTP
jgi:hypothetical protein